MDKKEKGKKEGRLERLKAWFTKRLGKKTESEMEPLLNPEPKSSRKKTPIRESETRRVGPAQGMIDYAKPLIDAGDGSLEHMNKALTIAQVCWNLAVFNDRKFYRKMMKTLRQTMKVSDEEFAVFKRDIIDVMIERHKRMFPEMHKK